MCVSPSGQPKDSNFIKEWTPCTPFDVSGVVREKRVNIFLKEKPKVQEKKIHVGGIVKDFVPKAEIGSAVKEVEQWCVNNGIELVMENVDKISAYVKNKYQ